MANDLTKLAPHIEQARLTLAETTEREQALVQALSDEMKRFDQGILQEIRTLAAEHETRRAGILGELQALAMSIGTFQTTRERPASIPRNSSGQYSAAGEGRSYHDELERNLRALAGEQSRDMN
jgi:hypothetical protein